MAGIIAVYGLVVSVLIVGALSPDDPYSLYAGFVHLAAGLSCGLTGLAAGHAIGIVGDAVRAPSSSGVDKRRRRLVLPRLLFRVLMPFSSSLLGCLLSCSVRELICTSHESLSRWSSCWYVLSYFSQVLVKMYLPIHCVL